MPHICLPGTTLWAVPRFRRNTASASSISALNSQINKVLPEQVALLSFQQEKPIQLSSNTPAKEI